MAVLLSFSFLLKLFGLLYVIFYICDNDTMSSFLVLLERIEPCSYSFSQSTDPRSNCVYLTIYFSTNFNSISHVFIVMTGLLKYLGVVDTCQECRFKSFQFVINLFCFLTYEYKSFKKRESGHCLYDFFQIIIGSHLGCM